MLCEQDRANAPHESFVSVQVVIKNCVHFIVMLPVFDTVK